MARVKTRTVLAEKRVRFTNPSVITCQGRMTQQPFTVAVAINNVFLYWISHIIKCLTSVTEISEPLTLERCINRKKFSWLLGRVKQSGDNGVRYSKQTPTYASYIIKSPLY